MVDNAMFDEGGDDWTAMGQPDSTAVPDYSAAQPSMMMMQQQDNDGEGDAFDNFVDNSAPVVTIQTASGGTQNLDDDLTEEEKEIVTKAAEL